MLYFFIYFISLNSLYHICHVFIIYKKLDVNFQNMIIKHFYAFINFPSPYQIWHFTHYIYAIYHYPKNNPPSIYL